MFRNNSRTIAVCNFNEKIAEMMDMVKRKEAESAEQSEFKNDFPFGNFVLVNSETISKPAYRSTANLWVEGLILKEGQVLADGQCGPLQSALIDAGLLVSIRASDAA